MSPRRGQREPDPRWAGDVALLDRLPDSYAATGRVLRELGWSDDVVRAAMAPFAGATINSLFAWVDRTASDPAQSTPERTAASSTLFGVQLTLLRALEIATERDAGPQHVAAVGEIFKSQGPRAGFAAYLSVLRPGLLAVRQAEIIIMAVERAWAKEVAKHVEVLREHLGKAASRTSPTADGDRQLERAGDSPSGMTRWPDVLAGEPDVRLPLNINDLAPADRERVTWMMEVMNQYAAARTPDLAETVGLVAAWTYHHRDRAMPIGWQKAILSQAATAALTLWDLHRESERSDDFALFAMEAIADRGWGPNGFATPLGRIHQQCLVVTLNNGCKDRQSARDADLERRERGTSRWRSRGRH